MAVTFRADVHHRGETDPDGYVDHPLAERIDVPDRYGPGGSPVVRIVLPYRQAEALVDALDLLDETADSFRASEVLPAGNGHWDALRRAITEVTAEMERAGLIPREDG